MLLKRTSPYKPPAQSEQIKGIFMPKEQRIETRNEICRAHFNLGSNEVKFPEKSFSHSHYSNVEVQGNKSNENKRIASQIKMQHFTIGDPSAKLSNQTSHQLNFAQGGMRQSTPIASQSTVHLNQDVKKELRKAHFKFGTDAATYQTTNQEQFFNGQRSASDMLQAKNAQTERKLKMRQQNFIYGTDAPQYVSMAKNDFPIHNSNEAFENLKKSKLNGVELRKSHFMMGSDPTMFQRVQNSASQATLPSKEQNAKPTTASNVKLTKQYIKYVRILARKSHIQLAQSGLGSAETDLFQYETVTGTSQMCVNSEKNDIQARRATVSQVKEMKQDLRNAHFHLGNDQLTYLSTAKGTLVSHDPSVSTFTQKLAHELSNKMQTVSFKIGDEKKRDLKDAGSIYKHTISLQRDALRPSTETRSASNIQLSICFNTQTNGVLNIGPRTTNIKMGTEEKVDYTSEAKEKFVPQSHKDRVPSNRENSKQLRMHHFTLEEAAKVNYYESVQKKDFNYKGDPREIRSKIPQEVKDNQRASHFIVGYEEKSPFINAPQHQEVQLRRPASAYSTRSLPQQNGLASAIQLKTQNQPPKKLPTAKEINSQSHVFANQPKGACFVGGFKTSNQSTFKWIQPYIQ